MPKRSKQSSDNGQDRVRAKFPAVICSHYNHKTISKQREKSFVEGSVFWGGGVLQPMPAVVTRTLCVLGPTPGPTHPPGAPSVPHRETNL